MRFPGQEQQVFESSPEPARGRLLRGPLFEEKVINFILELAQVEDQTVSLEELTKEPPSAVSAGRGHH